MKKTYLQTHSEKTLQLEIYISKNQYFSKASLPGLADALMFEIFDKQFPSKERYPALYYWFINIKQFSPEAIRGWVIRSDQDQYFEAILKDYRQQQGRHTHSQEISCESSNTNILNEFTMNVKLYGVDHALAQKVKTSIARKAQILQWSQIKKNLKILFRCTPEDAQLIKGNLVEFPEVFTYQIKKQRGRVSQSANVISKN